MNTFKIGKFTKKKLDDKQYIQAKLTGKFSAKKAKELKGILNDVITKFLNSDEVTE